MSERYTAAPERVQPATDKDADRCVAVIVLANGNDPAARWLYPNPHTFLDYFPRFVMAFAGAAFNYGSACMIDCCAAALWLPPGVGPDEEALGALIAESVPERDQGGVFAVIEEMSAYHPNMPHWYLPLIGTDPSQQNKGYGTALLSRTLAICDGEKVPAYLEATSARSVPLYQRHGFQKLGTIQIGASPTITPMLRLPRSG